MGQDPDAIREQVAQTRERMGATVEALGAKADVPARMKETVTAKRDQLVRGVSDAGAALADAVRGQGQFLSAQAGSAGSSLPSGEDVRGTARHAAGVAQQNPLGLAIGAAALGFLAGLSLPSTKVEDQRLGPMADHLRETAAEMGQQALEHGKQVAQDVLEQGAEAAQYVAESARETAQEHSQQLADDVRSTVSSH